MVYIIGKNGQPLMPTTRHGKVKHLLKEGKAKVVKRCPFIIKLLYDTDGFVQNCVHGQDTGTSVHGNAVYDENGNILYLSKVFVRNDITDKMSQRSKYRKNRRGRKTRYRKPRFSNRKNSKKKDRFSPTMTSKTQSHKKEIEFINSILPIKTVVLECGQFDTHLMKNPALASKKVKHWGYQKGPNYGFENTKAMVLFRDKYTCQCCMGKHKDSKLEVHHIIFRSMGGSDDESNLVTLCHTCHKDLHDGKINPKFKGKKKDNLKYATQMNSVRKQLLKSYPEAIETYGFVTKANRLSLNIEKDHHIDACVIASGGKDFTIKTDTVFIKKDIAKGDYQKTKGIRSEQKLNTGKIQGFKKFDKVSYFGSEYFIKGRMSAGYAILMDIEGKKIDFSYLPKGFKTPKLENCKRISARTSQLIFKERQNVIHPIT